jgi:hypothetical protein
MQPRVAEVRLQHQTIWNLLLFEVIRVSMPLQSVCPSNRRIRNRLVQLIYFCVVRAGLKASVLQSGHVNKPLPSVAIYTMRHPSLSFNSFLTFCMIEFCGAWRAEKEVARIPH